MWIFIYICAAAFMYWMLYDRPLIGIDDANIYFIYMRNFANGLGFVYNFGGERVEGFTSVLWTLIGSLFFTLSRSPEIVLLICNIFLIAFSLWALVIFNDRLNGDSRTITPTTYFICGALLLVPGYFDWTILSLMETGLWSFLLILSVITLCRFELMDENHRKNNLILSALLILLVLTRPESYFFGFTFLLIRAWQLKTASVKNNSVKLIHIIIPMAGFIAAIAGITTWRLNYFGYPLPNTYYAKISGGIFRNFVDGLKYDIHFFINYSFLFVIIIMAIAFCHSIIKHRKSDPMARVAVIIFTVIITALIIPFYTGGDHFVLSRFIQPVLPLFYLMFAIIVSGYFNLKKFVTHHYLKISLVLLLIALTPAYSLIYYASGKGPLCMDLNLANVDRVKGNRLSDFFREAKQYPVFGVISAGAEVYTYAGASIDLLGLNNTSIAHARHEKQGPKNHSFDKGSFFSLSPDFFVFADFPVDTTNYVIFEKSNTYQREWFQKLYRGLFGEKEFVENYFPVFIFRKDAKEILHTYANKNFLSRLDPTHYSYSIIPR